VRALGIAAAQVLYLFAPLLVSVMGTGVTLKLDLFRRLARPIDGGATFRGKRLFGDGKTWRVVPVALVASVATVAAQRHVIGARAGWLALVDYAGANPLLLGSAIGGGALVGELPNSFVKRQLGVAPGGTARGPLAALFFIWDQVDLLVFTWPLLLFWICPDARVVLVSFGLTLVVHPLIAAFGYLIGARKSAR
jgi:CDP-2,3-bis-(O-geranylgeranyl)-sn-glycerol synthase